MPLGVRVNQPKMTIPVLVLDVKEWFGEGAMRAALGSTLEKDGGTNLLVLGPATVKENTGAQNRNG